MFVNSLFPDAKKTMLFIQSYYLSWIHVIRCLLTKSDWKVKCVLIIHCNDQCFSFGERSIDSLEFCLWAPTSELFLLFEQDLLKTARPAVLRNGEWLCKVLLNPAHSDRVFQSCPSWNVCVKYYMMPHADFMTSPVATRYLYRHGINVQVHEHIQCNNRSLYKTTRTSIRGQNDYFRTCFPGKESKCGPPPWIRGRATSRRQSQAGSNRT